VTAKEREVLGRLRTDLQAAGWPRRYRVPVATLELLEEYYHRLQQAEAARWRAAGEPAAWPKPLWLTWTRGDNGVLFKSCELVANDE
jgi:hypothetical protein